MYMILYIIPNLYVCSYQMVLPDNEKFTVIATAYGTHIMNLFAIFPSLL